MLFCTHRTRGAMRLREDSFEACSTLNTIWRAIYIPWSLTLRKYYTLMLSTSTTTAKNISEIINLRSISSTIQPSTQLNSYSIFRSSAKTTAQFIYSHSLPDLRSFCLSSARRASAGGLKYAMCVTGTWGPSSKTLPSPTN